MVRVRSDVPPISWAPRGHDRLPILGILTPKKIQIERQRVALLIVEVLGISGEAAKLHTAELRLDLQ